MTPATLRAGPIEAHVARDRDHAMIEVRVGDFVLHVQATPRGRRVFLSISDGTADVQIARERRGGPWE